ncbi:MAG: putative inner membrane protein [Firmicutes bacterium ADurb.Bin248]|nr:MAG: putative inner membrane protein [Firmicutes bacterium ADurb.Bin248]
MPENGNGNGKKKLNEQWSNSRRVLLIVAFGVTLFVGLEHLSDVMSAINSFFRILEPVFLGIVIAFLANMPLSFLERRVFRKWKRAKLRRMVSALLSFLLIVAILTAFLGLIIPRVADSVVSLADGFDGYLGSLTVWADGLWGRVNLSPETEQKIQEFASKLLSGFDEVLSNAVSTILKATISVLAFVVDLLISFIIGFYALYNKEKLVFGCKKFVVAAFNEKRAVRIMDVASRTYDSLHDYFFGMITECTVLGCMTYLMMLIFGFPYAVLISVIVAMSQMVPILGPWFSGAVGVFIIFVTNPPQALWFALAMFIVQQIDDNLVYPRIVGRAVGLSAIWVMIAVILGGGLFGMVGIVLCVPIMAVIYTLVSEWVNRRVEDKRYEKGMRPTPPTEEEIKNMTEP